MKALSCKAVISQSPVSPDVLSLQKLAYPTEGEEKRKKKKKALRVEAPLKTCISFATCIFIC